jgi:hypothetical protein
MEASDQLAELSKPEHPHSAFNEHVLMAALSMSYRP